MSIETLANLAQELNGAEPEIKVKKRGKLLKEVPVDREAEILEKYKTLSLAILSKTVGISMVALTDFLKSKNAMRSRGHFIDGSTARRGKTRTKALVDETVLKEAMIAHTNGLGLVKFARAKNLNASELTKNLKDIGVEVKRGRRKKSAVVV